MRVLRLDREKMYISVTYDITSTRVRNKVVKLLESCGFRVQKSVFEIEITESQFISLKRQLEYLLDKAEKAYESEGIECTDSIKFYILSKVGEGNLDGRIDGLGVGYEKIYFPDILIL